MPVEQVAVSSASSETAIADGSNGSLLPHQRKLNAVGKSPSVHVRQFVQDVTLDTQHLHLNFACRRPSPHPLLRTPAARVAGYSAGKISQLLEVQRRRRLIPTDQLEILGISHLRPKVLVRGTFRPQSLRFGTATVITKTIILILALMSPHTMICHRIAPLFELSLIMTGRLMNLGVVLITAAVLSMTVDKAGKSSSDQLCTKLISNSLLSIFQSSGGKAFLGGGHLKFPSTPGMVCILGKSETVCNVFTGDL
ncbi:hypothetical protein PENANT_c029G03732 [Penicillium antarcticum]|uniref:Uncharacterized protein n=1 Tax=Penicillium antarcticum TaxID=416450 RepID=A0A1V6PVV7_9EURO|nr:hypothetical protein PENANT_c029G03732 [Penicillium antarcticum]